MRLFWNVLALFFAFLAVGGLVSAFSRGGSTLFDLVISALLAWAAIGIWRRTRA
ncbi:hypothetical protein [Streptomyces violascens]|uniref:hypothetical protein n=1 Tax=Streptomyces violascens TaxID=67381 RepID=UPI0036B15CD2